MPTLPQQGRPPSRWPQHRPGIFSSQTSGHLFKQLLRRFFFLLVVIAAALASLPGGLHAQTLINAGGPAAGNFQPDIGFTGGSVAANASTAIDTSGASNPAPAGNYVDERYGNFSYTVGGLTPSARYRVRLHFVESYWTTSGSRVFNVAINGSAVLTNFDIYASVGARNKLLIREFIAPADASGNMNIRFTSVVNNAKLDALEVLPVPLLAINAGGPAISTFSADAGFTGGSAALNGKVKIDTTGITNAAPMAAYNDERYGNFSYRFANLTPYARYRLRLHFVESYWTTAGKRVFNVAANGTQMLTNFDIFTAAGASNRPVIREFDASASSTGTITLQFTTVVNNAKVDALEIYAAPQQAAGLISPTPTPTQTTPTATLPAAPATLTVVAGNTAAALSWSAVSSASGYNVKRGASSAGPFTSVASNLASTSFNNSGLTNGTTYWYVVSALNAAGESVNSAPASVTPTAPTATTSPTGTTTSSTLPTGINIGAPADWAPDRIYADVARMGRSFAVLNSPGGTRVAVDRNGWPMSDFSFYVWADINQMHGTYSLSFLGQASVTGNGLSNLSLRYDPTTNLTSGSFQVTATGNSVVSLNFSGTRRDANSSSGSGITQLSIMRPITPGSTQPYPANELFNRSLKAEIAKFQVVRYMDFLATNSTIQTNWSDRPLPSWASFARNPGGAYGWQGIGGPLEHVVRLANETGTDAWIDIPARATDDYVRKVAQLFAFGSDGVNPYTSPQTNPVYPPLSPNLKLYVEYSNELWNTAGPFRQTTDNCIAASNELTSTGGNTPINFDKSWNGVAWGGSGFDWTKCWRRSAKRTVEISNIFRSVFGDGAMMTRVRPVLMSQLGYAGGPLASQMKMMLSYYNNLDGNFVATPRPPSYYIYAAGGSAYYHPSTSVSTLDAFFADPMFNPSGMNPLFQQDMALVATMGVKRIAYEGGPSLDRTGGARDAISPQAVNDPRMTTAVVNMHKAWAAAGGDLLVYYIAVGDFQWGFTQNLYNLSTPKLAAVDQLRVATPPAVTYGTAIPGSAPGTAAATCSRGYWACSPFNPATFATGSGNAQWASYLFRTGTSGSRNVTLTFTSATSAQVALYVDGVLVGTQNTSGSTMIFNAGNMAAGVHGLIVKVVSGTFTLGSIAVQ